MEKNCQRSFVIKHLFIQMVLLPLYIYRYTISPLLGQHCRFYPSCSVYSIAAIQKHGIIRGLFLTTKRLLKCHPWHPGGIDVIPAPKKERNYS